jgi:hypothetical protein
VMHRDGGVDQVAAKCPKASQDAILAASSRPRRTPKSRPVSGSPSRAIAEARSLVAGGRGMDAFPCCTDETQRPGMQARRSTRRSSRAGQMFTTVQCVEQLTVSVGRGDPVPAMRLAEAMPAPQGSPPAPVFANRQ